MKAVAVIPGKTNSAHLIEVEKPHPNSYQVLVKVLQVGIDGTDMEINKGLYGEAPSDKNKLIIGHESLGIVEKVGANVYGFAKGDLVVATVRHPCPENCLNCQAGGVDSCLTGNYSERGIKRLDGFLTQYYVENPAYLVKIPPELRTVGVLLEPLSILVKALTQIDHISKRLTWEPKTALVLGAGPIGLFATMLFRLRNIKTFAMATRPKKSFKAQLIEATGATYLVANQNLLIDLPKKLGNIDIIIEATGNSSLAFQAISILGANGIMSLLGVSSGTKTLEICTDCLNLQMVLGNKVVFGSVSANQKHFQSGIDYFLKIEEKWPNLLEKVITQRLPLEQFKKALEKNQEDVKTIIEIESHRR